MLKEELLDEAKEKGFMMGLDYALSKIEEYKSDYIAEFVNSGIKGFDKVHREIANRVITEVGNHIFMDCLCFHAQFNNKKMALNQQDLGKEENSAIFNNSPKNNGAVESFVGETSATPEK